MWRWCLDQLIFAWASGCVVCSAPREFLRLVILQAKHGVFCVRLAVPLLANEKYYWRKLFDHNPLFVTVTDKIAAKDWVASLDLPIHQPKTLWVGTQAQDIPDGLWQGPVLIKAAHGCQMNILVPDNSGDRTAMIAEANSFLKRDHGARRHQWAYGPVPRKLLVEEWVFPNSDLVEFKCYAFGGTISQIVVIYRGARPSASIFSMDQKGALVRSMRPSAVADIIDERPLSTAAHEAIRLSATIGAHFDHIRVDFLSNGTDLMLGELTVYNLAGRAHLLGHRPDTALNRYWDLRQSWFLTAPQTGWRAAYAAALNRTYDRRAAKRG